MKNSTAISIPSDRSYLENYKHQKTNHKWFGKPFDRPFDGLTVLSRVEGLTVLSRVKGLTTLSKVEGKNQIQNAKRLNH